MYLKLNALCCCMFRFVSFHFVLLLKLAILFVHLVCLMLLLFFLYKQTKHVTKLSLKEGELHKVCISKHYGMRGIH